MGRRLLSGATILGLALAVAAAALAAGKPIPGGYYRFWAGHGTTAGNSVTVEVNGQGTAAKATWNLLPTRASGCATRDRTGSTPYNNQVVGGVKVAITPDGAFHGVLRHQDWAQVGKAKTYLAEITGSFGETGQTAAGKLRLRYRANVAGTVPYTITCDGRWVSFKLRLEPDSVGG